MIPNVSVRSELSKRNGGTASHLSAVAIGRYGSNLAFGVEAVDAKKENTKGEG